MDAGHLVSFPQECYIVVAKNGTYYDLIHDAEVIRRVGA